MITTNRRLKKNKREHYASANDFERHGWRNFHTAFKKHRRGYRNQLSGSLLDQETRKAALLSEDVIAWTRSAMQRQHVLAARKTARL